MQSLNGKKLFRKAFSADKSRCTGSLRQELIEINDDNFSKVKSSSSDSDRRNLLPDKNFEYVFSDDPFSYRKNLYCGTDSKMFLKASKTLEKLSKIIISFSEDGKSENSCNISQINIETMIHYHETLKMMLFERYFSALKFDCKITIKHSIKLIEEFKSLYIREKLKLETVPIQTYNRFFTSRDISISTLEFSIKKIQAICNVYSTIIQVYQKDFSDTNTGTEYYFFLSKVCNTFKNLRDEIFYWGHKNFTIFIKKLCFAEPSSVSQDFLQSILHLCHAFDFLVKKNNDFRSSNVLSCDLHFEYVKKNYSITFPTNKILDLLSYYEAKIASEKIVYSLSSACKKSKLIFNKEIIGNITKNDHNDGNSSGYCSSSIIDIDADLSKVKILNLCSNNLNVWTNITQRNQSLILKYFYAITSLHSSNQSKGKISSEANNLQHITVRPLWSLPENSYKDESYFLLEEFYWTNFWNRTERFILNRFFEMPQHQYGDSATGSILLWPDSYLETLLNCIKINIENMDIILEGRCILKQIYDKVFALRIFLSWDQKFNSVVFLAQSHVVTPVPTTENQVKSHCGSTFCICLETLFCTFSENIQGVEPVLYLQWLQIMSSVLDCFNLWADNKSLCQISLDNLTSYLIISCSDCPHIHKILQHQMQQIVLSDNSTSTLKRTISLFTLQHALSKQIEVFLAFQAEVPNVISQLCFQAIKDPLLLATKHENSWKKTILKANICYDFVESFLFPMTNSVQYLSESKAVLVAITEALTQAFLAVLNNTSIRINFRNVQLFRKEFSKFLLWVERLNLPPSEQCLIQEAGNVQKMSAILEFSHTLLSQKRFILRNRVMPSSGVPKYESILSEAEKQHWRVLCSRTSLSMCF